MSEEKIDYEIVFKALASKTRIKILSFLAKRENNYNRIARAVGLNPLEDAGKFAYHVHRLVDSGLISKDDEGVYSLTLTGDKVLGWMNDLSGIKELTAYGILRRIQHIKNQILEIETLLKKETT